MEPGIMLLRDIAESGPDMTVQAGATLREMIARMNGNGKGVVVVLEGKKVVGILTERDVVRLLFAGVSQEETAGRIARKPVIAMDGRRAIGYAFKLLIENNVRRLVVVDNGGNYLGVVTHKDLLKHLEEDCYRSTLKVKHVLDNMKSLVSVQLVDSITEVLKKMVDHKISAVPVLAKGKPVGIVTEKDVLRMAHEEAPLREGISLYMSADVVCAGLDTGVIEVVRTMNAKNISRVVVTDPDGSAIGMITNRDLVRNLEGDYNDFLERKFRQTKEFLNMLPEMMLEIIDTGKDQLIIWANDAVACRFGREILDKPVSDLIPRKRWEEVFSALVRQNKIDNARFKKDDRVYECSGFYMRLDRVSEVGRAQLIMRDITEDVMLATTDPLTGAYNRRFITEFLAKEAERSLRTKKTFALVLADLDNFKKVNDTHGHLAGDAVLKAVVGAMKRRMRQYDLISRYGGEEFLIVLPEIERPKAVEIAERLRLGIESLEIETAGGRRICVTSSFGVALFGEDGKVTDDLLVKVDERLYRAKREGRNRIISE